MILLKRLKQLKILYFLKYMVRHIGMIKKSNLTKQEKIDGIKALFTKNASYKDNK